MKKLSYLLMPLLILPAVGSCNKPINDKINSQEELMAAVHFDNIEYAQVIEREPKDSKPKQVGYKYCSPFMYHYAFSHDGESVDKEEYVEYKNNLYTIYSWNGDEWETKPCTAEEFITPKDFFKNTFLSNLFGEDELIFGRPLTLDDFDYSNGEYVCKFTEIPGEDTKCKILLSFLDKKVKRIESYSDQGKGGELVLINSFEFEYKQITPELPDIPIN